MWGPASRDTLTSPTRGVVSAFLPHPTRHTDTRRLSPAPARAQPRRTTLVVRASIAPRGRVGRAPTNDTPPSTEAAPLPRRLTRVIEGRHSTSRRRAPRARARPGRPSAPGRPRREPEPHRDGGPRRGCLRPPPSEPPPRAQGRGAGAVFCGAPTRRRASA